MAEIAQEFVNKFHNLEGVTVAEKKRNLLHLLRTNKASLDESRLALITAQLTARTHLERIFLVEFLIYHRRFEELRREFLRGDEIVVSKISKQDWFFRSAFENVGAEFVTDFLPTLSVSLRLKILKKLTFVLDEERCDEVFDALLGRYGVFTAKNVLTSCSNGKIEAVLKEHPIELWGSQQKLLYLKDPNLFRLYLEELVKRKGDGSCLNYEPIFKFVAARNPEIFCELQEKYKFKYCRLGKRSTKKLVRAQRDNIVARPELYTQNLHRARLVRTLGPDFKRVYLKLFPQKRENVLDSYNEAMRLFHCYPKRHKFDLFRNTFDRVFYQQLEQSHSLINDRLLGMIADGDERERWAKIAFERQSQDFYLAFFKASTCIDIVSKKMANQSSKKIENVGIMTRSCVINGDMEALLAVCALLCGRFKNDGCKLHMKFLEIITKNRHIFRRFGDDHWKYMKEIISRREIRNQMNTISIVFTYFEFLYDNDRPLEEEIVTWANRPGWFNYLKELNKTNPKSERAVLSILIEVTPKLTSTIEKADCQLILACKRYNSRNSAHKIDIFRYNRLLESVKRALVDDKIVEKHIIVPVIEYVICAGAKNNEIDELNRLYWTKLHRLAKIPMIKWFLRHRPDLVAENIDRLLSVIVNDKVLDFFEHKQLPHLWKAIKCYSHLGIDRKVIEFCNENLNNPDFTKKNDLIAPLSMIMPPTDFLRLAEAYKPSSSTVDMLDEESNKLYQLRRHILKNSINLHEPEAVMPVVMQFCEGDYVASCLTPLYSCLYRIPQNRMKTFLDRLCETGAVSVKKHGFYFVCVGFDDATVLNSLKSCRLTQAIAMSYQHFVKNPSQQAWDVFKNKVHKLDKNDQFTIQKLVNIPAPTRYQAERFEILFEVLHRQDNKRTNVVLDKLRKETVGQLPRRFFETIKDKFLTLHKSDFIFSYYLIYGKAQEKFDVIFEAMRTFKEKNWSFREHEPREKLHKFVATLLDVYVEREGRDDNLIDVFLAGFREIFLPAEAFEEFVILSSMKLKSRNVADAAREVVDMNRSFVDDYGGLATGALARCLNKHVLTKIWQKETAIFEFYFSLLSVERSVDNALLVLLMLPRKAPHLKESASFYYDTLKLLKEIENETVKVHFNFLFREEI